MLRSALLLAVLLLLSVRAPARAEIVDCTPVALAPGQQTITLSAQGSYCLADDISSSIGEGSLVTIANNNITLNCNDRKLGNLGSTAGLATRANGIRASGRSNITVRNCIVRGFRVGISLTGSGHAVENNLLDQNTTIGISVSGDGSLIRRNRVLNTGGNAALDVPIGLYASFDVDILDNTIDRVYASPGSNDHAYGIFTWINKHGSIGHNRVRNVLRVGTGNAYGIFHSQSGQISMFRNRVANPGTPGSGIRCESAAGIAGENHVNGYAFGIVNCRDGGRNAIVLTP